MPKALVYVHGLRPLGARREKHAGTGARRERTLWQRACSYFSSGLLVCAE